MTDQLHLLFLPCLALWWCEAGQREWERFVFIGWPVAHSLAETSLQGYRLYCVVRLQCVWLVSQTAGQREETDWGHADSLCCGLLTGCHGDPRAAILPAVLKLAVY